MEFFHHDPFPLHLKRDRIARELLKCSNPQLDWVLMVDSDMLPPENTIQRLESALSEFDIVGGLCFARRPPHPVCAGIRDESGKEAYLPLDVPGPNLVALEWVGTGCVMIKRQVFEQLPDPWFVPEPNGRGEDLNFMWKAKQAGFQIGCARDLHVGHLNLIDIDYDYSSWWNTTVSNAASDLRATNSWSKVTLIHRAPLGA
jgi:GT2 family glycosyltransferase